MNYISAAEKSNTVNTSLAAKNVKVLQNGSNVRVVITKADGNGNYEGSVAGVKVRISAKNPMQVGSSFTAKVNFANNQIQLVPEKASGNEVFEAVVFQKSNDQILNLLAKMGLPQNEVTDAILFQLKQLEMPIEKDLIQNILRKSDVSGKKKIKAAQLIAILKSKGIDIEENNLKMLLQELDLEWEEEGNHSAKDKRSTGTKDSNELYFEIQQFKSQIFNEKLNGNQKAGNLTVLNHINGKSQKTKNWIILPFNVEDTDGKIYGKGCLKFLLNYENQTEKVLLSYNCSKIYYFLLNFNGKNIQSVNFYISETKENEKDKLILKIRNLSGCNEICWSEEDELAGTAAGTEMFVSAGGLV